MSRKTIAFSNPDDVMNFVRTVEKYPFDMDVRRGKCNRKIELHVYEEECQDLFQSIEQYVVA